MSKQQHQGRKIARRHNQALKSGRRQPQTLQEQQRLERLQAAA